MALPTTYSTGTATINNGEATVTGQGTTWLTSGLQAGDIFWAGGSDVRIAAVNSNTSLTLAFAWPGATRTAQAYEVRLTPDATRVLTAARAVLDAIASGNIKAIGDLLSAADKLPYSTGPGTWALTDFKAIARQFLTDNFMPVQQGGGADQQNNKIKIGWDGNKIKAQVDTSDRGSIWTDLDSVFATGVPGYWKAPNGHITQWGVLPASGSADLTVGFPVAFVTGCLGVVAMPSPNPNTFGFDKAFSVYSDQDSFTTTSFVARRRVISGGNISYEPFMSRWIAWGI